MKTQKNKAITLVALVITMVILIILAGVSINMLFGENGIITKAKLGKAKFLGEDAREVVEQRVAALKQESAHKGVDTTLYDFWFMYNSEFLEDGTTENKNFKDDMAIYLFTDELSAKFKPATKKASRPAGSIANCEANYSKNIEYKTSIVVYKDFVVTVDKDIIVSSGVMNIDADETLLSTLESANINNGVLPDGIKSTLNNLTISVPTSTNNNENTNNPNVIPNGAPAVNPITSSTVSYNSNVSVSVNAAKVDIIWLTTSNQVLSVPNMPTLSGNFEEVTYNNDENNTYYTTSNSGNSDLKDCKWLNAKDTSNSNSLFVWIPRYAYRITYYNNTDLADEHITGYYDGFGMYNKNGEQQCALEDDITTVDYNGNRYIVHPAFTNKVNVGGWNREIPGFWYSKYIISGTEGNLKSVNNASDYVTNKSICVMFNYAKGYLAPNNTNSPHLSKNSEWGAIATLSQSKYGRNTNDYLTGLSTTGNDYGVTNMSGGYWNFVAIFNRSVYSEYINNNSSNLSTIMDLNAPLVSNEYLTMYDKGNDSKTIYEFSITGDAMKEFRGLFSDWDYYNSYYDMYLIRGGASGQGGNCGIFASCGIYEGYDFTAFHLVLIPN